MPPVGDVLEELATFFGCGKVYVNRRYDNHREDISRYCVSTFKDLRDIIVPIFNENPLRTAKQENFEKFAEIISLMSLRLHLTMPGIAAIAQIAETMNHRMPSQFLRILRGHTPTISSSDTDEMKRWSEPCGDVGRLTETYSPPIHSI